MESSLDEDKKKKKTLSDSEDEEEDEEDDDDEQVKKPVIKSDKTNDKKRIVDDEDENEEDEENNNNNNTGVERKNRNATSGEENDDTENDEDDYYDDEDDEDEDDDDDSDNKNRDDSDYDDDDDDDEDESNDDDDDDEDRKHNDDSNYSSDSSNNDRSDDSDYDYFKRNSRRRSGRLSKVSKKIKGKKSKTKNKQKSNNKSVVRSGSSKSLGKKSSSSSSSGNKFSFRNRNAASSSSSSRKVSSQDRRSTASKTINYCEDSDDDAEMSDNDDYSNSKSANLETIDDKTADDPNVETIEKVLKARVGRVGATGSKTAIYNVEEHGDPNANFNMDTDKEYENQYLIKWQGWSHLHNTWESKETLMQQKVKGMKKLENFLKKEDDIRQSKLESAMSPEDLEYFDCQAEMFDNLLETHSYVERIIADNVNSNQTVDYLCKWEGLPYSECTWEDGELIKKRFSKFVEEYERRQAAQTYPPVNVKTQKALRIRPRFVPLKEKPAYLGNFDPELKLRDYQLDGLNWLANSWCKQNGIILADEMGLGKTIQAISFMSYVFNEHNLYGPFLVVLPLSTMQGWQREFQKWSPEINTVIYLGDGNSRSMIQKYEWLSGNKKIKCNAVLTTYEILLKDKAFFNSVSWAALVVDEAHRLKNEDSLLYRTLIKFDTNHRLLITGTPLQNSLKELWSLLHFIMPEKFDSWEEFDQEYSSVLSDGLRFQDLHRELQPYLLRRVKKDVEKSLPAKVEQILRVEMTKIQKQYYKLILTKNYKELAKGAKGNVNSFLNIMMELKKCSNHIFLIRRDEATSDLEQLIKGSGKLLLLDKLLRRLKETGHRVLIFSQMVRMLDILAEYLQYRRFPFQRLDGSIKGEVRRQALDHFNREDSEDFCFLLSTRAGGLGINLSTADTVIIYDSDWNPQNDLQAQARAHRIGQKNQVNIYRLVSKNSIEEDIVERAKQKMVLDHLVIQRMDTTGRTVLNKTSNSSMPYSKEEINSILKFGAEELFKEKEAASGAVEKEDEREELQAYDIDEILKRAETREETSHLSASEELLSQFKVANFSTIEDDPIVPTTTTNAGAKAGNFPMGDSNNDKSWDEIIPEFERRRAEQEEEDEKIKLMNLTLESRRNRPTSFGGKNKNSKNNNSSKQQQQSSEDDEDFVNKSFDSADTSDSEHHRTSKSGGKKKKNSSEHTFKGLNAQEIRRFVRSYRKFPCPLMKIDTIAQDAHLEEKSQACLIDFAKKMQSLCNTALSEYENNHKNNDDDQNDKSNSKKRDRGPIVVINGVTLYAQQILDGEKYFEPLTTIMPQLNDTNNKFQFKTKLKQTYWDCEWTEEDDKSLLKGIYEYGYGNWEWIKADPNLKLTEKILINEQQPQSQSQSQSQTTQASTVAGTQASNEAKSTNKLKPQSKHLRTRIDYLIKVIQNQILTEKYGPNWKSKLESNTTRTSAKSTKRTRAADDATPGAEHHQAGGKNSADQANDHSQRAKLKRKLKTATSNATVHSTQDSAADSDNSETNSETKKKRNNSGEDANHHHHHHHHHHGNTMDHGDQSDSETTASNSKKHHHHPTSHKSDHHHHHHHTNNHQQHSAAAALAAANDATKKNPKEKKIILSEKIFEECKNILRPVKKALKNIDMPKEGGNLNERDHIERIKPNILEIGDTINDHLTMYSDPDKIKLWRNYLWVFVAKFTSNWSWERIKNLYKKFSESRDDPLYKPLDFKSNPNNNNNNNSNSNYKNYDSSNNNNNKSFNPTSTSSFSNCGNHMYNHGGSQKYYNKYDNNNKNEPFQKSYADKKYSNDSWKNDKNDKHKDGRLNYGKKKDFGHNHRRESDTRDSPMSGGKQLLKSSDYNHQNANYSPVAGSNNNNNYSSKQPYFSQNYDFNAPSSSPFAAHASASTSAQQANSMKPYSRSNHGHGQMYPNAAKPHNYTPNENNANMMYESPTSSSMNTYQHHHHQHHHHHSPGGVPPPPPPSSQSSSYMPPNYSDYNRPHFSTSSSNYQYVNPKSTSFQRNLSPSVQNPHDSAKKHRKESHEDEHRKFKDIKETPTSQASSNASNKPSSNQ